jgi:integrase
MTKLEQQLKDGRAEITAKQYLSRLRLLNDDLPFNNLTFLKNKEQTETRINTKSEGTRASYYTSIITTLGYYKSYDSLKKYYMKKLDEIRKTLNEKVYNHEKTDKQQESMIPIAEIKAVKEKLKEEVEELNKKKVINANDYEKYIQYLLVSLYVDIPPRRNQDYAYMVIVKKAPKELDADKNYYIMDKSQFVFNKYKTHKLYGQQIITVPDVLRNAINMYLKRHPNMKKFGTKTNPEQPLLINFDGSTVNQVNGITRRLNKAFDGKIGATALRHIFLSDTFGDQLKERLEVAKNMGHSVNMSNDYIKIK